MTLDEILALPYNGVVTPRDDVDIDTAIGDYEGQSDFSRGFTVDDYRKEYRNHGEPVRHWAAIENGESYIEQTLDPEIRVLVLTDMRDLKRPNFGQITAGDLKHCGIPDEIFLAPNDRVLYPNRSRAATWKGEFENDVITLPRLFIHSVKRLYSESNLISPDDYEVDGRVLTWVGAGDAPESVVVLYRYTPQYEFRGEGDRQAFEGADAGRLPQIVPVFLLGEEDEVE